MVQVEIEVLKAATPDDVYHLRNWLREQFPQGDFVIREQSPAAGQMGIILEPVLNGLLHATTAVLLEELYHNLLKPVLEGWIKSRKKQNVQLEIMSSLSDGAGKKSFVENEIGETRVYDFSYAIDTDKTIVLLIGSGKFTNDFHPIPPVKGNLEDLFRLLTDKRHIGIPRDNVLVSFNESHVEIQKHLLQASRRPDIETLMVYFTGHGHKSDIRKLSLIAADTEKIGDEIIGGIDFDFISNKVLKTASAKQKILILDTCHSGIATQGDDGLLAGIDVKGSYILSSSPGDEVSYFEKSARNTYFTGALLDVLENGVDGPYEMLTLDDLYSYSKSLMDEKKFPLPTAKNDLNIPSSRFFIARNPSFSAEKLKWKANNLFHDGKLEEALDEYRSLLRKFPGDEDLRRQYETCETEYSFAKLVNEADSLFYGRKDYAKAASLYKRAYQLKKDALVMDKIRQCEQRHAIPPGPDPLLPLQQNEDYQAFRNATARNSWYAASLYLEKALSKFPANDYLRDEMTTLGEKLKEIRESRKDQRLSTYFQLLDKGQHQEAMAELNVQLRNDPEYPVFIDLQQALGRKIKEAKAEKDTEDSPRLYRLFKTFTTPAKVLTLLVILGLITWIIVGYIHESKKEQGAGPNNPSDSTNYFSAEHYFRVKDYQRALPLYERSSLPAAKDVIGWMYLNACLSPFHDTAKALEYFKKAMEIAPDTIAASWLGFIAKSRFEAGDTASWAPAVDYLTTCGNLGRQACLLQLAAMYCNYGNKHYYQSNNLDFDKAYSYFDIAAGYGSPDAMGYLGDMFNNKNWAKANSDSAFKWYQEGMNHRSAFAYNGYATMLMDGVYHGKKDYDSALLLLNTALSIDSTLGMAYTNLGAIYENGGGNITPDLQVAIQYYRVAARKGRQKAIDALKRLKVSQQ
jgi:tetratricopeptide (TPR) repeat protein